MNHLDNPELKNKRATIRPSPTASTIQLIALILLFIFGLVLLSILPGDFIPGIVFLIIWLGFCLMGVIYSIINIMSFRDSRPNPAAVEVVEIEDKKLADKNGPESEKPAFSIRLRELEALKKDGLINEEEYQRKRREILDEKW
jgi:hypothetical protein